MKNPKVTTLALGIAFILANGNTKAHQKADVPAVISTSFTKKYPKAEVRNWDKVDDTYIAKAKMNGNKCYVKFDKNGKWISTKTKIAKSQLPVAVTATYKKTKYAGWNVYYIKKVERPSGYFYQILVDDSNSPVDANHQRVMTTDKLLEFKATGELTRTKDVTDNPVP